MCCLSHPCLPTMTKNTFASFKRLVQLKIQRTMFSGLLRVTLEQLMQFLLQLPLGQDQMHQTFVKDFIGVHLAILRHMSKKQAVQVEIGCSPQLYISYVQVNSSQEMKQPSSSQCKCIVETAVYAGDNCFCLSLPVKLLSSHHHCITAVMYASRSVAVRHVNVLLH